jgi:TolB protein
MKLVPLREENCEMKTKAIALVLMFAATFIAFQVPAAYALEGTEIQVTTDLNEQFDPAIDGDYIVFTDNRAGNKDVYLHNLATGEEMPIADTEEDEYLNDVSGNYVVYTLTTFDDDDIYVYDIESGEARQITDPDNNEFAMRRDPAISGNYVVWQDNREGSYDIYLYNLETDTETLISTGEAGLPAPGTQIHPAIHENLVVWEDHLDPYNPDIYVCDISDPDPAPILIPVDEVHGEEYWQNYPDVYGRYVVFDEAHPSDFGNRDVVLWDLDSNAITWRTTNTARQERARIDGTRVVWEDSRNGNIDIYTYAILTESIDPVVTDSNLQFLCDVSGDRIVWTDLRNVSPEEPGNYDIYMFEIARIEVSPTSGAPGLLAMVTGSGFPAVTIIEITFDGELVATVESSSARTFTTSFVVPLRPGGTYTLTATSTDVTQTSASTTFEVLQPIMDVDPTSLSFGDVELGQSSLLTAVISNEGNCPLAFSVTQTGSLDFTFNPAAGTLEPEAYVELAVTYAPSDVGLDAGTLTVNSNDFNTPVVEVALVGNGFEGEDPVEELFQSLLDFYDLNRESGGLQGNGPTRQAIVNLQEVVIRNKILQAYDDYLNGFVEEACEKLQFIYEKIDGVTPPPDFIVGDPEVMEEFRQLVLDILNAINYNP